MDISEASSVVVIGCHPDDVKSLTGMMLRSVHNGAKVSMICITNGERHKCTTYEEAAEMGERRKKEQVTFLSSLGIPEENVTLLGFPNGALSAIREDFWQSEGIPFYAMLLRADRVIDKDAYRQDVPFFGETFLGLLKDVIAELGPTHVFTHHPKDYHDDHRAAAFFVKKAVSELVTEGRLEDAPETYSALVYFPQIQWPPAGDSFLSQELQDLPLAGKITQFHLTPEELDKKREACKVFIPTLAADYIASYMKPDELYWEL